MPERKSFRAYSAILYLDPRMKIYIQVTAAAVIATEFFGGGKRIETTGESIYRERKCSQDD